MQKIFDSCSLFLFQNQSKYVGILAPTESLLTSLTYMVSLRQEQNPIMKFAVPFLKMLALCMLWRAQFLSDFYSVFCVHQKCARVHLRLVRAHLCTDLYENLVGGQALFYKHKFQIS